MDFLPQNNLTFHHSGMVFWANHDLDASKLGLQQRHHRKKFFFFSKCVNFILKALGNFMLLRYVIY